MGIHCRTKVHYLESARFIYMQMTAMLFFICMLITYTAHAESTPATNLATLIEKVSPSVVNIHTSFYSYAHGQKVMVKEIASGSIFDEKNGYIITNAHAVAGNNPEIDVELKDGRFFKAIIVGRETLVDLAVLKIQASNLQALPMGNANDLHVGQDVIVIGSAFGFKQTVTKGIISALQRGGIENNEIENYIQTDAPINPGNSGGPLINLDGEMIGVNVSMYTPGKGNAGIGFAIPLTTVKNVIGKILKYGKVTYSTLGIKVVDLQGGMSYKLNADANQGAVIVQLIPGSPAALAGLRAGDIITHMDNQVVKTAAQLQSNIHLLNPGQQVEYTIARQQHETLKKTIATKSLTEFNHQIVAQNQFLNDIGIEDVNAYTPIWGATPGVKINFLHPDRLAAAQGLRVGDIILAVNFQPTHTINELRKTLASLAPKDNESPTIFITILRGFNVLVRNLKAESSENISFIEYI